MPTWLLLALAFLMFGMDGGIGPVAAVPLYASGETGPPTGGGGPGLPAGAAGGHAVRYLSSVWWKCRMRTSW